MQDNTGVGGRGGAKWHEGRGCDEKADSSNGQTVGEKLEIQRTVFSFTDTFYSISSRCQWSEEV